MILKLGIGTVALVGGILLAKGELDVITFFMFLMVVSRIYDPMQVSLQNLAAIIAICFISVIFCWIMACSYANTRITM